MNNYIAACRALNRIETILDMIFTEKIMGRYNDKEMLACKTLVNLDINNIQNDLWKNNISLTFKNIFDYKKKLLKN